MEAVAISIANSALNSVVMTATTAITNEIGLLLGVQEELFFIKEELEMMQAFLWAASTEETNGKIVTTWVKQVQELAYDVEDCLQEASVDLMNKGCIFTSFTTKEQDRIAGKIQVLKVRIDDVSKRNLRYGLIKSSHRNGTSDFMENHMRHWTPNEEASIVGMSKPKQALLKLIFKNIDESKVMSVVGMGGLGKTTLVKNVYESLDLSNVFNCFAWITVIHPFNKEEFIESLVKQFSLAVVDHQEKGTNGMKKRRFEFKELETMIIEHVKDKRFVLVLDDLASENEWKLIEYIFLKASKGSRIIVTTRSESLAELISKNPRISIR